MHFLPQCCNLLSHHGLHGFHLALHLLHLLAKLKSKLGGGSGNLNVIICERRVLIDSLIHIRVIAILIKLIILIHSIKLISISKVLTTFDNTLID